MVEIFNHLRYQFTSELCFDRSRINAKKGFEQFDKKLIFERPVQWALNN